MKLGLRTKLFLVSLGLLFLTVFVVYGYARRETELHARETIEEDLVVRLQLVVAHAEGSRLAPDDSAGWDALADRLGTASGGRITFVAIDGRVLGDSRMPIEHLPHMDDHSRRPEVAAALQGRVEVVSRHSTTLRSDMVYVAAPIELDGTTIAVARMALSTTQVDEALSALGEVLVVASALALAVSVAVAFWAVQIASRRVSNLTRAAGQMAAGNLEVRTRASGSGEFAELGRALDRLAKNLNSTLGALKEERDRLSGILSSMEEGVLFLDEEGNVAHVNPALREMLLLQGELTGRPLLEVVRHADLKEMIDAAIDEDFDDEEDMGAPLQGELQVHGLKPRQLLVRVRKLEGLAAGVIAVFLDVTKTRRLENMRREFVANVSHELRTPVTSIRSAAETLESAVANQPSMVPRFVDIIERNASRLQSLVEDVLDLSRIESRQFSMTLGPLEPRSVLTQQAILFEEKAAAREVHLHLDIPDDLPEIRADRRGLEHVISNLVDNAVKYAGKGKNVNISARSENDLVEFIVSDDGPGIDEKHLPRLFERFYRVDTGRSRDLGGTGLGLAIVKHLLDSMGGTVRVESNLGAGTTFRVRMPVVSSFGPRGRRRGGGHPPHTEG